VAHAQPAAQPTFATTKVEGTDNVYYFRYQGHQALFVVTPEGVIGHRPDQRGSSGGGGLSAEIRKITQAPVRYVIYSHSHADHIAGGKPFKDAGATFVRTGSPRNAIAKMNRADIVPVDETVDDKRTITLGGTEVELLYVGKTTPTTRWWCGCRGSGSSSRSTSSRLRACTSATCPTPTCPISRSRSKRCSRSNGTG